MQGMKTPGSGRKAGTPNKTTREMRALVQQHGPRAIERLGELMEQTTDPQLSFDATCELLDRGYGKPSRAIELQVSAGIDYDAMTDEELAFREHQALATLRANRQQRQLPAHVDGEQLEIVDGGVVMPEPDAATVGLNPAGERPQEVDKP
jgi:hypothetical protein